ncbi:MAG: MSHA biogenesis protein MshJ [Enterobacterales bacterium]|jgi:MSHA biogenesis protein MshJ
MKAQWVKACEKIVALSQREKILVLLTGLIIIPGILDFFLLQPLRDVTAINNKKILSINSRMESFTAQQDELLIEIKNDPSMELERRIGGVSKALEASKAALVNYTDTLIAPQKMAAMLEKMLHDSGDLKLLSLENLAVTPLFDKESNTENVIIEQSASQGSKDAEEKNVFGLYRHGIRIVFQGNYMKTKDYLQKLETLPWKFYWQYFDYQVEKHPKAKITLTIYTLSTSKWWIGDEDE